MHKRKRAFSENPCDFESVVEYFNKRFSFTRDDNNYSMPELSKVYTHEKWFILNLQHLKTELNNVKGKLSSFDLTEWSQHTKTRDPAGYVFRELKQNIKPELLTQAWCKFYECICQFPQFICEKALTDNTLNSVHLCEAPGAFISALNHYLATHHPELKWDWIVNSLNPEYEGNNLSDMIPDKRLFNHTKDKWKFGADSTGDITKYYNYESLVDEALKLGKILLVTADGSINCMSNPGEQECLVEHLHFCEVITALTILSEGGTFVLKLFTIFECSTICLLYLLMNCFQYIHVFKPCTSKSGNSEIYIICLNYISKHNFTKFLTQFQNNYKTPKNNLSMFPFETIPQNFINQIEECMKLFNSKQITTINNNINCFQKVSKHEYRKNDYIKNQVAQFFLYKYKLTPNKRLLTKYIPKSNLTFNEKFTVTTTTFQHKKHFNLEFEIGLKIKRVYYSEFCDHTFLTQLFENTDCNLISHETFDLDIFTVLNFSYNKDYCENVTLMFKLFHDTIAKLKHGDHLIINGFLFLTRFEVSLFYLLMCCFTGVQYYNSVVVLKVVNDNILNVREHFQEINQTLKRLNDRHFEPFILNVLPYNLIKYEPFIIFLQCYNNKTLNDYFNSR